MPVARAATDEAYRRERAARRRDTGLSANEYHRRQAERASHARMREAADRLDDTLVTLHRTKAAVRDLDDANEELRRQNERLASEAEQARAQAEAAGEAARAAAAARERVERDEAKGEAEKMRNREKKLGPDGVGINWQYKDGHVEHEKSVREVREVRDAEVEAARAAQAQAEAERDEAVRARDAAVKARKKAVAERDNAAKQLQDIRADVEALGPDGHGIDWEDGHEQSLRDVREDIAGARDELADAKGQLTGVYQDIDRARDDLKVATGRGTLRLRDVVAAWLRARADELTERTVDAIAPETVHAHRALADMPDGYEDTEVRGASYRHSGSRGRGNDGFEL